MSSALPAPGFDPALATTWPDEAILAKSDFAEAAAQQLLDCEDNKRENPYYRYWTASSLHYLASIYSSANGSLRLEGTAQAELAYASLITRDQQEIVNDPTFQDRPEEPVGPPSPRKRPALTKELAGLKNSIRSLDGDKWKGAGNQVANQVADATSSRPRKPLPVSTASTVPATKPNPKTIYRTPDGLFLRRERLHSLLQRQPNADPRAPAVPVASLEVKVPPSYEDAVTENDTHVDEAATDVTDDGDSPDSWVISEVDAALALENAMGQIVQHVQFIFHQWEELEVVWAIGACGRWVQFFRFERDATPAVDITRISPKGSYYVEEDEEKAPLMIPVDSCEILKAVDDQGYHTLLFRIWWRKVIDDAEKEFKRMNGL
ncbi:hypothetical protein BDZ89DRAFT_1140411 [Hymenopellis radicata]|nr:hypothetical protein BDZ89DRAFT_1140411 [Hymenopellis radicata]